MGLIQAKDANEQCRRAACKGMELDEMLPEAHAMIAACHASNFDWKTAEWEFYRALELDPKSQYTWHLYSLTYLLPMRRTDEAFAALQEALELDPLSPVPHLRLGLYYTCERKWEQAIQSYRSALEIDPYYVPAYFQMGIAYIRAGGLDEGIRAIEVGVGLSGEDRPSTPHIWAYGVADRNSEARNLFNELQELARKLHVPASAFATSWFSLGNADKGFDWLEKSVDEGEGAAVERLVFLLFAPLCSHPRCRPLLRKMNLEP